MNINDKNVLCWCEASQLSAGLCRYYVVWSLWPFILVGPLLSLQPSHQMWANIIHVLWKKKQMFSEVTCPGGAWLTPDLLGHNWVQWIHYITVKQPVWEWVHHWTKHAFHYHTQKEARELDRDRPQDTESLLPLSSLFLSELQSRGQPPHYREKKAPGWPGGSCRGHKCGPFPLSSSLTYVLGIRGGLMPVKAP